MSSGSGYDIIEQWLGQNLPTKAGDVGNGVLVWPESNTDAEKWCNKLSEWQDGAISCGTGGSKNPFSGYRNKALAILTYMAPGDSRCGSSAKGQLVYLVMDRTSSCHHKHRIPCYTGFASCPEWDPDCQALVTTPLNRVLGNIASSQSAGGTVVALASWPPTIVDPTNAACSYNSQTKGFGNCCVKVRRGAPAPSAPSPLAIINPDGTLSPVNGGGGGNGGGGNGNTPSGANGGGGGGGLTSTWTWIIIAGSVVGIGLVLLVLFSTLKRK